MKSGLEFRSIGGHPDTPEANVLVIDLTCYLKLGKIITSRVTVGRVKPFLDLHKLCACDAIMILYKVWSGRQFPVPESFFSFDF